MYTVKKSNTSPLCILCTLMPQIINPSYTHIGQNSFNPNNNLGIQIFSHLDIPTKYQYLTGTSILILRVGSLILLLMLVIHTMHHLHIGPTLVMTSFDRNMFQLGLRSTLTLISNTFIVGMNLTLMLNSLRGCLHHGP